LIPDFVLVNWQKLYREKMTIDITQRPSGSVVIIGAGTQGRRLAFMVSRYFESCQQPHPANNAKWSGRGGSVCLVDLQEQQLQDGLSYVHQLRNAAVDHDRNWGDVSVSQPNFLESILQDAWLVVEVLTFRFKFSCAVKVI
jgi:hypothetical protein